MYPDIEVLRDVLIKESYISEEDSKAAEAVSKTSSQYVQYLISNELLTLGLLGEALAESHKLPFADLGTLQLTKEQINKIPEDVARAQRAVYVKSSDQVVAIATDAPKSLDTKTLQKLFPKQKIRIAYTLPEYIEASFGLYEQPLPTRFAEIIESGRSIAPEIVDEIIKDALRYKASDIHFEPDIQQVRVRFRVDGTLREAGQIPKQYYENVLNRVKVESGMRIDEHFTAQDGAIQYNVDNQVTDLRVGLVPTVQGEKVVMRVLGSYVQGFTLADIGLGEPQQTKVLEYANKPFGMILTTGPTGSGKTTTLYALLKLLNKPDVNITTIEDPVEYKMAGVNQIQVHEQANMTFGRGLRAIVRQDPDVILVGEIRDEETAEISVNAALTGHLLLSTFHANDAATAIPRLIDMGIEPFLLASTLEVVIAQRLVRKICSQCRYTVELSQALKDANAAQLSKYFTKNDTLYSSKGCTACNGTGYRGRIGLFEFLEMTPDMQELVVASPSSREIEALARKQGDISMFEDGIMKVKAGQTTLKEILRVVVPPRGSVK